MAKKCKRDISDRAEIQLSAKTKSLSGQRFGRVTAMWPVERRNNAHILYFCVCDCGVEMFATCSNLKSKHTQSCGCQQIEITSEANATHGRSSSRLYGVWQQMKQRCHLESAPNYKWYGARGIEVCERWRNSFESFAIDMGEPPLGHWIERQDNNGPYAPWNCVWAPPTAQAKNTSSVQRALRVAYLGASNTLSGWGAERGLSSETIRKRLQRGWPVDRALAATPMNGGTAP